MIDEAPPFDDGRGRYPDRLGLNVPRGFRQRLRLAAEAERLPVAEFVRRAVSERVARATRPDGDDPGPFSPATGMRAAA